MHILGTSRTSPELEIVPVARTNDDHELDSDVKDAQLESDEDSETPVESESDSEPELPDGLP